MAIKLNDISYNYSLSVDCLSANITDAGAGKLVYGTDTTYAEDSYAKISFFRSNRDELEERLIGDASDPLIDTVFGENVGQEELSGTGVCDLLVFFVLKFGGGAIAMKTGNISYYETDDKFYIATANNTLGAAPTSNWRELEEDELTVALFTEGIITKNQNESYFWKVKVLSAKEIELKLVELQKEIGKSCHTVCTYNRYEFLRKKYEAMVSYLSLKNYSKAEKMYDDIYNGLNSISCC
jgi:hypothetical protein